jgi:hypothetical protein
MLNVVRFFIVSVSLLTISFVSKAQTDNSSVKTPAEQVQPKQDFQIFLKQPAKQIKLLMYEKNFLPIQGKLSDDKKSIIMKDYEKGSQVHVKVVYEDGTVDEFTKSPCYIDPVIS